MEQGAWDALRDISKMPAITERRPIVGRRVRVISGKHLGLQGVVTWHGRDRYTKVYRYGDAMTHHMTDIMGLHGFRVRVAPDDGSAPIWAPAESVCVL